MTAATSPTALETKQRPWWLTLMLGVSALVFGAAILWGSWTTKTDTYMMLVKLLGVYWLVIGIMDLVHMFVDHSAWAWKLIIGIISIIAGATILMYPVAAAVQLPIIFVWVVGFWGLFQGILMLIMAFKGGGWAAGILGVLGIVFGLALMANYSMPGMGLSMIWLMAVAGVVGGCMLIYRGFQQRKLGED